MKKSCNLKHIEDFIVFAFETVEMRLKLKKVVRLIFDFLEKFQWDQRKQWKEDFLSLPWNLFFLWINLRIFDRRIYSQNLTKHP